MKKICWLGFSNGRVSESPIDLKMVIEKPVSKGGFFQIFDWSGKSKSRKNIFSSNYELDDEARQRNRPIDKLMEFAPDAAIGLIHQEDFDSNQASSVSSSDEGYGTTVPSVVAKLMGLDSLPSSIVTGEHHCTKNTLELANDHEGMEYDVFLLKPRSQKATQRFRTQVLPPNSTKSVTTIHHKLLPPSIVTKSKNDPSSGSSSIPFRIQDLKQKTVAAKKLHRPVKPNDLARDTKILRSDVCNDRAMQKTCLDSENDDKSLSLALQAKLNVQRREEISSCTNRRASLTSGGNGNYVNPKNRVSKIQSGLQSGDQKRSTVSVFSRSSQKQNIVSHKDKSSSKTPVYCQQVKKSLSSNGSCEPSKAISTVVLGFSSGLRTTGSLRRDIEKDFPSPKTQTSQKKQFVGNNKQNQFRKKNSSASANHFDSVKSSVSLSGSTHEVVDITKNCLDVVSFTFNSPIKRSKQTLSRSPETGQSCLLSDSMNSNISPSVLNIDGGDALSASNTPETVYESVVRSFSDELQKIEPPQHVNNSDSLLGIDPFSGDISVLEGEQKQQGFALEKHCRSWKSSNNAEMDLISQHHIPISGPEPCCSSSGSCLSRDSHNSECNNEGVGVSVLSPTQSEQGTIRCLTIENDSHSCKENNASSTNWEFQYVKNIVTDSEPGNPRVFEEFDMKENAFRSGWPRLERKVWFECIEECLDLRLQQQFYGGKGWFGKKSRLVGELYKEIMSWKKMRGLRVDDVVEWDMSRADGKWVEFGMEGFEEGVEIERHILSCLINDLVTDLFFDLK